MDNAYCTERRKRVRPSGCVKATLPRVAFVLERSAFPEAGQAVFSGTFPTVKISLDGYIPMSYHYAHGEASDHTSDVPAVLEALVPPEFDPSGQLP